MTTKIFIILWTTFHLSLSKPDLQLFDKHHQKLSKLLLKLENSIHRSLVFGKRPHHNLTIDCVIVAWNALSNTQIKIVWSHKKHLRDDCNLLHDTFKGFSTIAAHLSLHNIFLFYVFAHNIRRMIKRVYSKISLSKYDNWSWWLARRPRQGNKSEKRNIYVICMVSVCVWCCVKIHRCIISRENISFLRLIRQKEMEWRNLRGDLPKIHLTCADDPTKHLFYSTSKSAD